MMTEETGKNEENGIQWSCDGKHVSTVPVENRGKQGIEWGVAGGYIRIDMRLPNEPDSYKLVGRFTRFSAYQFLSNSHRLWVGFLAFTSKKGALSPSTSSPPPNTPPRVPWKNTNLRAPPSFPRRIKQSSGSGHGT